MDSDSAVEMTDEASELDFTDNLGASDTRSFIIVGGVTSRLPDPEVRTQLSGSVLKVNERSLIIFEVKLARPVNLPDDSQARFIEIQDLQAQMSDRFAELNEALGLAAQFMDGQKANWYPLIVSQDQSQDCVDYRPRMHVDYNIAVIRFAGRPPEDTRLKRTVSRGMVQWQVMEAAVSKSRLAAASAEATSAANLDSLHKELADARRDLLRSIVSNDMRTGLYEGLDFEFAHKLRNAWQFDALESMVKWSLDACGERIQLLSDAQQESGRRSLRIVLAMLTVASALTALLTAVDFSTSDTPLDADSVARILTAIGVIGLAVVLGIQLHRKGVD